MERAYSYDFDEATLLLSKGSRHEDLAKRYGYSSHSGFTRRYNRDLKKATQAVKTQYTSKKNATVSTEGNHISDVDDIPYGELPYTGYISDKDHYEWGREFAPEFSKWDRLAYLDDLQKKAWNRLKLLIETGRDHGKTWAMVKLFARWVLEKKTKCMVVATQAKRDEIFQAVYDILRSPQVRKKYGDVIASAQVTKCRIKFIDELKPAEGYNFAVWGTDAYITGLHATDGWIHLEDIIQELRVAEAAEKRLRWWFKRTVRYIKGVNTKLTATGTRKDLDDIYGWFVNKYRFPLYLQEGLVIESGRLPTIAEIDWDDELEIVTSYPEVGTYRILGCPNWTIERLLYEFIFHTEDAEAELNNNPLPSSGHYFDGEDWQERPRPNRQEQFYNTYQVCDPSFGTTLGSSKTAILVLALINSQLWIIDAIIKDLDFDDKEQDMIDYYGIYNPLQTWVEDNFRQMSRSFSQVSRLQNLPGLKLILSTNDKKERIAALKFAFRHRDIIIADDCPYKQELKAEYLTFALDDPPTTIKTKYNGLDALSIAYMKLRNFIGRRQSEQARPMQKTRVTQSNSRRIS